MSEKKVGKRLLTWVLVLVMTLSLLPLNVLADEIPLDEPTGEEAMIDERDNVMDVSLDGIAERKSSQNYATWWPVFWGFDKKSEVTTANLIKVTAGTGNTVLYASEQLSAKKPKQPLLATQSIITSKSLLTQATMFPNTALCAEIIMDAAFPLTTPALLSIRTAITPPQSPFWHRRRNSLTIKLMVFSQNILSKHPIPMTRTCMTLVY